MSRQLVHRGPDDEGIWIDATRGVGLGFRRLAILDTSPLGAQPMRSQSGRYVIVFNGEVYNFVELGEALEQRGFRFKGHSDTEVILASMDCWGVERAVEQFVGMFAMAVWDDDLKRLSLLRDRLGIKPLYYLHSGHSILFASEIKGLAVDEEFDSQLDGEALASYLRYLYVPAPSSIFRAIKKLLPGHLLHIVDPAGTLPEPTPYWSLHKVAARGIEHPLTGADGDIVEMLADTLREAVRVRLRSDVPLGVLLSGGVDSSTVAALAQSELARPVKTFSIGFDVAEHDEASYAEAVANHIGSEHVALEVSGNRVLDVLPRIARIYDEPLADPSQLPTLLVSELARGEVTVALSGDGGDELFSGYNRYIDGMRLIPSLQRTPAFIRQSLHSLIAHTTPAQWDAVGRILRGDRAPRLFGQKMMKFSRMMGGQSAWEMYRPLLGVGWECPDDVMVVHSGGGDPLEEVFEHAPVRSLLQQMAYVDQGAYLPDELLAKVDRASMAVSLEVRVPILDHRVVEASWSLPASCRVRDGNGKWALRQVLYQYVPRALVDRPKVGFTPPVAEWLRGPLRTWASDLLSPDRITAQGVFRPAAISAVWRRFLGGRTDLALQVWTALQFQAWSEQYL